VPRRRWAAFRLVNVDVDRALAPGDERVDVATAYPGPPAEARASLDDFLVQRRIALATEPQLQGWPAWNLTRERARAALAGWVPPGR